MKTINNILTIGIFSTLFFSSYVLFKTPFEGYLSYVFIILLLPFFFIKYQFPYNLLKIFIPMLLVGLLGVYSGNNTIDLLIKISINILISGLFYNYIFYVYQFNIEKIMSYYMKGALIVSIIGLTQVVSYKIGFSPGYNYSWIFNKWGVTSGGLGIRLNSIFSEPSYFAASIGPAFFVAIYNLLFGKKLFINKIEGSFIILAYILTFSTVAYVGIFITIILLTLNYGLVRYIILLGPITIFLYLYLYNNVPEFRDRITGLDDLYTGEATSAFNVHGSSFVQYNNFHVAFENFKDNPAFGTGLGSHPIAYKKYSLIKQFGGIYDFNKMDGNSMAFRLMSETGLFGMGLMLFFIIYFFVKKMPNNENELYWVISNAALVIILLQLFRQGNYTYNGFFFYMWLYYFCSLANRNKIQHIENQHSVESNKTALNQAN